MNDISKVFNMIDNSDFRDVFYRFKRDIVLNIVNRDVQYYNDGMNSEMLRRMFARCPDNVKNIINKVTNDANDIKVSLLTFDIPHYELYIIINCDKPIVTLEGKPCDGYCATANYKLDSEADDYLTQFLFLSEKALGYKNENRYHIVTHEIVHLVLMYLSHIGNITQEQYKMITDINCEEFLADFLPFYMIGEKSDYINNFLLYGKKWFKEDVFDKYKECIKQLIPYFNAE